MDPPDSASPSLQALEQRRARILASINAIGALRPGTVSAIYTKCGRPNCHCQQPGDRGHGPYFRLVYNLDGKQRTRALSARQAVSVRADAADHPGHGPRWILTHAVDGKTRTRTIPPDQLDATRAQIAECQRLRRLVAELIEVSDQACQAKLEAEHPASDPPGAAKKLS